MKKLFSILCIITLLSCGLSPAYAAQPLSTAQCSQMKTQLFQLMNKERKRSVRLYAPLSKSSQLRAKEAAIKWSHTRPNRTRWNTTIQKIINIKRVPHGENLAKITITYKRHYSRQDINNIAKKIHQSLKKSRTHYKVMTNPKYKKANIGIYTHMKNKKLVIVVAEHYIR